jgi:hypothetical protein
MAKTQSFWYYVGLEVAAHANNCKPYFFWIFWPAIVHTYTSNDCKSSHVLFSVWNCSYVQTIASHICFEFVNCNRSHIQMIAHHVMFYFLVWNCLYVMCEWLQAIFILNLWTAIVRTTNDCKSCFFLLHLWSAIVLMRKWLQAMFVLNLWSAIVRTYKWFQAIFVLDLWSEIVRTYKWFQAILKRNCGVKLSAHVKDFKPYVF